MSKYLLPFLIAASPLLAQDFTKERGFYLGIEGGSADQDNADTDTFAGLIAGWQFNRYWSIELGPAAFGEVSVIDDDDDVVIAETDIEGWRINVMGMIPLNQRFRLYGKAGVFLNDTDDYDARDRCLCDDNEAGPAFEGGVRFRIGSGWNLDLGIGNYRLDFWDFDVIDNPDGTTTVEIESNDDNVTFGKIGVSYIF